MVTYVTYGNVELWLCGNQSATLLSQTPASNKTLGTLVFNTSISKFVWKNTNPSGILEYETNFTFTIIKTL